MAPSFDAIVVGIGSMGSAACLALARRGVRVLGLEQFDIAHALGSHHGHSRLFREAYFEHPDYVPLLREARRAWIDLDRAFARPTGTRLFFDCGLLYLGRAEAEAIARTASSALANRIDHQMLDRHALAAAHPQFTVPEEFVGLWEPGAGFVVPELAVSIMAGEASRLGAEIHGREPVRHWQTDAQCVRVLTDRTEYAADRLIFTGGPWTAKLMTGALSALGVGLRVTRQTVGWFWPSRPDRFAIGRFPCWAIEAEGGRMHYGVPMTANTPGVKIALHLPGDTADPDAVDRAYRADDEADMRRALARFLPDAGGPLLTMATCLYTMSPDGHFVIDTLADRIPGGDRVALACGFSGHGFKFAPVVGEALADLATAGSSTRPISFLRLGRFSRRT